MFVSSQQPVQRGIKQPADKVQERNGEYIKGHGYQIDMEGFHEIGCGPKIDIVLKDTMAHSRGQQQ